MQKPLRILVVVDLAWDARLGAVRVFMGLSESWRAAGHSVARFCLDDAFPNPPRSRFIAAWRRLIFPRTAAAFIRGNSGRFDVIDSLLGTLPFARAELSFDGLLVARSVGFFRHYEEFEKFSRTRWPQRPRGKLAGRIFYRYLHTRASRASQTSLLRCDLVNAPNEEEIRAAHVEVGAAKAAIVLPYGLTATERCALREAAAPPAERLRKKKIGFIGMWSARKGAKDWATIIQRVRGSVPDAQFVFLGTLVEDRQVFDDIGRGTAEFVELVPEYAPDQLPALLADVAVGAFPTYAEGFGLALLEQLAAGVPTVAYGAPGPRAILGANAPDFLVPIGDVETLAAKLAEILRADPAQYEQLVARSVTIAARFQWDEIADQTINAYRQHLSSLRA